MTFHSAEERGPRNVKQPRGLSSIAASFAKGVEQPDSFVFEGFLFDRFQRF